MKAGMLEKKLKLESETAVLIRERVASTNMCLYCMDANRWSAMKKAGVDAGKLDALTDYQTSPPFSDSERTALAFATELTEDRHVSPDTFAELARHSLQHQQHRPEHRVRRDVRDQRGGLSEGWRLSQHDGTHRVI